MAKAIGATTRVRCTEVVRYSESPLWEVSLYNAEKERRYTLKDGDQDLLDWVNLDNTKVESHDHTLLKVIIIHQTLP